MMNNETVQLETSCMMAGGVVRRCGQWLVTRHSVARVRLIDQQFCISSHINKWPAVHNDSVNASAVSQFVAYCTPHWIELNESSHSAVAHARHTRSLWQTGILLLIILILHQCQWLPVHCPLAELLYLRPGHNRPNGPVHCETLCVYVELSHSGAAHHGCVNSNSNYFLFHFLLGQTLSRSQASAMRGLIYFERFPSNNTATRRRLCPLHACQWQLHAVGVLWPVFQWLLCFGARQRCSKLRH